MMMMMVVVKAVVWNHASLLLQGMSQSYAQVLRYFISISIKNPNTHEVNYVARLP
jgi:hypothetical protein